MHGPLDSSPVVSVVITCHNLGRYLPDAVASVLAQTFRDFEIIVVDDGSTDSDAAPSLAACAGLPDVRVLRNSHEGLARALNRGIRAARGRYILPLDADDRIGDRYLEKAVPVLEARPSVGIVYCQGEYFGDRTGPWRLPPYTFPEILVRNVIFSAALFRKEDWARASGYRSNMTLHADYDFWLSLIGLGRHVLQLPDTLFYYRQRPGSLNKSATSWDLFRIYLHLVMNHPGLYAANLFGVAVAGVRLGARRARRAFQV